jgi:hypothetical protein
VLAGALSLAGAPAALGADPALGALRAGDAYASPRVLGESALEARAQLAETAARLRAERRPVKLAVVAGPVGSPSMRAYARRLSAELGGTETLVVTAPGRAVVAVGPRPPAQITRALRAERVGRIANPVERVIAAALVGVATGPDA